MEERVELNAEPNARLAAEAAGIGLWDWEPASGAMRCTARTRSICGLHEGESVDFESFLYRVCRDDRNKVRAALERASVDGSRRRIECRMVTQRGESRWVAIEGKRCVGSDAQVRIVGVARDITARKENAAQREILVRELTHRINNAFAVLSAIVSLSARTVATPTDLARVLQSRIGALARAYSATARPDIDGHGDLQTILEAELAPFIGLANIDIAGERTTLEQQQATAMTLILHELATNAMKHGALGKSSGRLSVEWSTEISNRVPCVVLHWREHCPERIAAPARSGLGTSLLRMSARSVAGDIWLDFQPSGLAATLILPCTGQHGPAAETPAVRNSASAGETAA